MLNKNDNHSHLAHIHTKKCLYNIKKYDKLMLVI